PMQAKGTIGVLLSKIALRVGPRIGPAVPVRAGIAFTVALPARLPEVFGITPEGACQVWVGSGDDDLAQFFQVSGAIVLSSIWISTFISGNPDIAENPGQRVGMGIGTQGEVCVPVEVCPDDTAVLGCPVRVDVLTAHQVHPELLHRRAGRLGTEGTDAQGVHVVLLDI